MASTEFCTLEGRHMKCVCKGKVWLTCTSSGAPDIDGGCLKCWQCGRIATHDGAIIRRSEVKA